jgi:hypothetical protein
VFVGERERPYLRGAVCAPERAGKRLPAAAAFDGLPEPHDVTRDAALLVALGVLEPHADAAALLEGPASDAELHVRGRRAVALGGMTGGQVP